MPNLWKHRHFRSFTILLVLIFFHQIPLAELEFSRIEFWYELRKYADDIDLIAKENLVQNTYREIVSVFELQIGIKMQLDHIKERKSLQKGYLHLFRLQKYFLKHTVHLYLVWDCNPKFSIYIAHKIEIITRQKFIKNFDRDKILPVHEFITFLWLPTHIKEISLRLKNFQILFNVSQRMVCDAIFL